MPVTFDLNRALSSPEYAKMCYVNYKTTKTMGISDEDFGRIIEHYDQATIDSWAQYSEDENQYEWTDDEHGDAVNKGKQRGQNLTGYENNGADQFDQTARVVGDGIMAGATGARALYGGYSMVKAGSSAVKSGAGILKNIGNVASSIKTGEQFTVQGAKAGGKGCKLDNILLIASCAIDLTMGILAVAKPANKEQADACAKLTEEMPTLQEDSATAATDMMTWNEELIEHGDNANVINEEANDMMAETRGKMDPYLAVVEYFEQAQTAGDTLTQADYEDYAASLAALSDYDKEIKEVNAQADEDKQGIMADMGEYEGNYDEAAQTIDEVQGVTDFSEEFDEKTETACQTEKYMQWIGAAGAAVDAVQATMRAIGPQWFIYGPAALAAAAGAVMSGIAAGKQGEYQQIAATEVDLREQTQTVNTVSQETYDENIDYYEGYMEDVENLDLVEPDDYVLPGGSSGGETPPTGEDPGEPEPEDPGKGGNPEDPPKKPKKD